MLGTPLNPKREALSSAPCSTLCSCRGLWGMVTHGSGRCLVWQQNEAQHPALCTRACTGPYPPRLTSSLKNPAVLTPGPFLCCPFPQLCPEGSASVALTCSGHLRRPPPVSGVHSLSALRLFQGPASALTSPDDPTPIPGSAGDHL